MAFMIFVLDKACSYLLIEKVCHFDEGEISVKFIISFVDKVLPFSTLGKK